MELRNFTGRFIIKTMKVTELLDAIKKHGLPMVMCAFVFLQLNYRISSVEKKYEDCIEDRINEAFRSSHQTKNKSIHELNPTFAILTEPIRVRSEKNIN